MSIIRDLYSPTQKFDDQKTWDLISSGRNIGCFQIESQLLRSYSKKLKPNNINDLSGLIAIVRPGTLENIDEKTQKNMAVLFCDRKNGEEPIEYLHPSLEPILKETYGVLVFQEQAMEICRVLAGFNLQEADNLRKAAGKKKPEEMAKIKIKFLDGTKRVGLVTEEEAQTIFGWIEKSQRYSFNRSHSQCYAILSYMTAYLKANYPKQFYIAWLQEAKNEAKVYDEIKSLINDAKLLDIDVHPPRLYLKNKSFTEVDGTIYFGLNDIRGIGEKAYVSLINKLEFKERELNKPVQEFTWMEMLQFSTEINVSVFNSLIKSGALSWLKKSRQEMAYELEKFDDLTDKVQEYVLAKKDGSIVEILDTLTDSTKLNNRKITKKQLDKAIEIKKSLENPPFKLTDSHDYIYFNEEQYLGTPLTCHRIDGCDTSSANCNVSDILQHRVEEYMCVAGTLDSFREVDVKGGKNKGKKMAFGSISDSTGMIDSLVIWSTKLDEFKDLLIVGNTLLFRVRKDKEKDSVILEKVWQI